MPARNHAKTDTSSTRNNELIQNKGLQNGDDIASTYNELKQLEEVYGNETGIMIRGSGKRRRLPLTNGSSIMQSRKEDSGIPVGTEYHWYILAQQSVRKLDANKYSTSMTGLKYKLGHK